MSGEPSGLGQGGYKEMSSIRLTNNAVGELRVSANEYTVAVQCSAHGAQINFGDLTPCLTYGLGDTTGNYRMDYCT
jgi:hypothetical protein